MSNFKEEEIEKKVGNVVYLKEGVRKSLFTNDYLEKEEEFELALEQDLIKMTKYHQKQGYIK